MFRFLSHRRFQTVCPGSHIRVPDLISCRAAACGCVRFPCLVCGPASPDPDPALTFSGRRICHSLYGGRLSVSRGALHPLVIFRVTASPAPLALPVSPAQFAPVACIRCFSGSCRASAFLATVAHLILAAPFALLHSVGSFVLRLPVYSGSRDLPIRMSPPDRPVVSLRPRAAFLKRKGRAEPAPFLKKPLI